MLKLQHALLASLCLLPLAATEAMATTAGVTAAVNQNAKSTPPGGTVRTVVLGANVVQDETIETDGGGLVQILLADGTTFTVGPNSSITIDRFVYDPNANTAQVSATIGRGVFRFIGGRTSKTEGGVQLNTPVGTVGIRGGMADLNFTGAGQIDLLFGNEVTLDGPNGSDRIFQPGYSIVFGPNGQPTVIKTPPGSANFIQQALAGRPGQSGGSSQKPDDGKVADSGVSETNSGGSLPNPQNVPQPDLRAIDLATPKPNDNHQTAENVALPGPKKFNGQYSGYSAATVVRNNGVTALYRNILPEDVSLNFSQNNGGVSGKLGIEEVSFVGSFSPPGTLEVAFGPDFGGNSVYYNDLYYYGTGPTSGIKLDGVQVGGNGMSTYAFGLGLGSGLTDCDCDFIQVGYWLSAFDTGSVEVEAMGTFVVGDITTDDEYEDLIVNTMGSAAYSGVALGFLTSASGTETAMGNLYMEYNLDNREGWMEITDFGSLGVGFGGRIDNGTGGSISGAGMDGNTNYAVDGSFVGNGQNQVAGVIGNFAASNYDDDWSATGVFAGRQSGAAGDIDRYVD